jgi:xylulokinase
MLCGIDLGTSALKCGLFEADGRRRGMGRADVGLYKGEAPDEAYAEPLEWAKAAALAIEAALSQAGSGPGAIEAIAISGNGPTLLAAAADGLPIGRALSWLDRSALDQALRIGARVGRPVDPAFYLPKALKLLEDSEKGGGRPARFFSAPEYLAFLLGAEPVSYLPDPYYERFIWDMESAEAMGLDLGLFPPYARQGQLIGAVSAQSAAAFGLAAGTPIVAGFPDFLAALVGSGATKPGVACDRSGSSEALNLCAKKPFKDERLFSLPHALPGLWNQSGGLSTSGKALEWFSRLSGYAGQNADTLFNDFQSAEPGADGALFLPYLAGERAPLWQPSLRGAFLGLSLGQGRKEMARAVVESLAYGLRLVSDIMAEDGEGPALIRCSGGQAHNDALCALKADVLGIAMEVPDTPECETLGDACAAACALGYYGDMASASAAMVHIRRRFEPDPGLARLYDEGYGRWKKGLDYALAAAEDAQEPSSPAKRTAER